MWPRGGPLEDGAAAAVDSGHIDKQEQPRQRIFALLITARARAGHLCIQDKGAVSRWTVIKEYSRYAGLRTKNLTKFFETAVPSQGSMFHFTQKCF